MGHRSSAGGGDPIGGGRGSVSVAAIDHDSGAVLCQQGRNGRTDTPRPADHDGAAVGQQRAHSSVPNVIMSRFQ
jgi:hypothetical protein